MNRGRVDAIQPELFLQSNAFPMRWASNEQIASIGHSQLKSEIRLIYSYRSISAFYAVDHSFEANMAGQPCNDTTIHS